MKTIQIDDDLYQYIASNTLEIGEPASDILRRLLLNNHPLSNHSLSNHSLSNSASLNSSLNTSLHNTQSQGLSSQALNNEPSVSSPVSAQKNTFKAVSTVKHSGITQADIQARKQSTHSIQPMNGQFNVLALLSMSELESQKGAVGRFLYLLSLLHQCHANEFHQVLTVKGSKRCYFATSAEELMKTGTSIKSKQIPNSDYWVLTNNNTARKQIILFDTALMLGYTQAESEQLVELILSRD